MKKSRQSECNVVTAVVLDEFLEGSLKKADTGQTEDKKTEDISKFLSFDC